MRPLAARERRPPPAPISTAALLLGLSLHSRAFLPRPVTAQDGGSLLGTVLLGGIPEEVGWTGCAIPRLRRRHGVLATGLAMGVLWAAWHFPVNFWYSSAAAGELPLTLFVPLYFLGGVAQLTAYRVLMVWVYDRTESLLLAALRHGSLIASTAMPILVPPTTGAAFLTWFLGSAAVLWVVVGVVAAASRGHLDRARPEEPARKRQPPSRAAQASTTGTD